MWVARDKDGNYLNMFFNKPIRHLTNNVGEWIDPVSQKCSELCYYTEDGEYIEVPNFEHLKWEDEPVEVKLVPQSADVIEMPSEVVIDNEMDRCFNNYNPVPNSTDYSAGFGDAIEFINSKIVK